MEIAAINPKRVAPSKAPRHDRLRGFRWIGFAGVLCGISFGSQSAAASTIIVDYLGSRSTSTNDVVTIPSTMLTRPNTYDFRFNLLASSNATTIIVLHATRFPSGADLTMQYQLYAGAPGTGTFLGQSSVDFGPSITFNSFPGDYYIEITSGQIARSGEVVSGLISTSASAVPEPGAWAMMTLGILGLGMVMRSRKELTLASLTPAPARLTPRGHAARPVSSRPRGARLDL